MKSLIFLSALGLARAYWLMGIEDVITVERLDPIVNPGRVSGHAHAVLGGSNFGSNVTTEKLRQSECTSIPIPQDKSNYWYPQLYFQWKNGSFSSMNGGAVIYYLFGDQAGTTTAFPDDFRMLSGDPTLRTYDPNSFAQQAVTFLCLDFNGVTTRHNELPAKTCPSGIRAQINFPSCWDGKNLDSSDHKSHVAFMSEGPDKGSCKDPKYPVTLPRIFIEVYWSTSEWESVRSQAMSSSQPFVYSHGDPTGYGYHADFYNGWDKGVLQKAVDNCHCNMYGDPKCCVQQGIFDMNQGKTCRITKSIDEQTTGTIPKLPGNNPVQPEGAKATMYTDPVTPPMLAPVCAYTGDTAPACGKQVSGATTASNSPPAVTPSSPASSTTPGNILTGGSDGKSSTPSSTASSDGKPSSTAGSDGKPSTSPSTTGSNGKPLTPSSTAGSNGKPSSSPAGSYGTPSSTGVSSGAQSTSATSSKDTSASSAAPHSSSSVTSTPVSSSVASSSTASSTASSGGVYNSGTGSGSNSPPTSGNSGSNSSQPNPPAQSHTSVPSNGKGQTGSCNIGKSHQYLAHKHKHHHGRSLRRVRRSLH